jgi:hypothetical protein
MMDFSQFALTVMKHVRNYVQPALDELVARIDEREGVLRREFEERIAAIPSGKDGEKGIAGEAGAPGAQGEKGIQGDRGERGIPGDRGKDGAPGEAGPHGEKGEKGDVGERGPQGEKGEAGPVGDRGEIGPSGKDADPSEVAALLLPGVAKEARELVERMVKEIPAPKDGRDGLNGVDGKSVSADDVLLAFGAEISKRMGEWALDFERRAQDILHRAVENIPKPANGKDGADGLGFDDLAVEQLDERHIVLRFTRGDVVKEFPVELAGFVDRGVFKHGETYERGDSVSWGGSTFFAQKRAPEGEPGASADWRLGVKRGRDGKDGVVKTIDPNATVKIPK